MEARRLTLPVGVLLIALLLPLSAVAEVGESGRIMETASTALAIAQPVIDKLTTTIEETTSEGEPGPAGGSSSSPSEDSDDPSDSDGDRDEPSTSDVRGSLQDQLAPVAQAKAEAMQTVDRHTDEALALVELVRREVEQAPNTLSATIPQGLLDPTPEEEPAEEWEPQTQAADHPLLAPVLVLAAGAATAASVVFFWMMGSSGAATAAPAAQSVAGRRLAPIFSPLFTRFEGRKVLEHPNRMELYGLVSAQPGIRLQDLCNETGLSRTAVTHHLRLLEQQHLVVSKHMGRSRHFYENGGRFERTEKEAYAILQNERSREVAHFIQHNPGTIQKQLCEALGVRASIAHWHVRRLEEAALIQTVRQGRTVNYYPADAMARISL